MHPNTRDLIPLPFADAISSSFEQSARRHPDDRPGPGGDRRPVRRDRRFDLENRDAAGPGGAAFVGGRAVSQGDRELRQSPGGDGTGRRRGDPVDPSRPER